MTEMSDELRPEYDFRKLLKRGVRGKYAEHYRAGTNLVLLEPDVAKEFPSDKAVNEALLGSSPVNRYAIPETEGRGFIVWPFAINEAIDKTRETETYEP